jgi:hypothetical protein
VRFAPFRKARKNQIKQNKTMVALWLFYFVLSGFFLFFHQAACGK